MKYNCDNCGKGFDKKSNYEYHLRRIRPCVKKILLYMMIQWRNIY